MAATGCTGASHSASPKPSSSPSPSTSVTTPPASSTPAAGQTPTRSAAITPQAFGMHYLGVGTHPYPSLSFGTARVWDMGVTWKDLQPTPQSSLAGSGSAGLQRLDAIVDTFRGHRVEPIITLGQTPAWAARSCRHRFRGVDWGAQTCAPRDTSRSGPWARYVRALATRYRHSVHYFELWNEPSLRNGYNDSPATLAQMQLTAHRMLKSLGFKQQLVLPGIPFTDGAPTHGLNWLDRFLSEPGGTDFDIAGFHLYPGDEPARAGIGPEWSVEVALPAARAVLAAHGVGSRPVWNTETNVGRIPAGITFSGATAAAMLARTFILAPENNISRTIWYAADDHSFGGTAVESDGRGSLTVAGVAERYLRSLLIGAVPTGCVRSGTTRDERYTCKFTLRNGRQLLALWTTGRAFDAQLPSGTSTVSTVTGSRISSSSRIHVNGVPIFVVRSQP